MFGEVQEQEDREERGGGRDKGGRDIKNIKNQFYNLISTRRDATNEIYRRSSVCTLPGSVVHHKLHE